VWYCTCFICRSALPPVNNHDFIFNKIFIHATVNNLCDILMIGNSGQIFRYVFCYYMFKWKFSGKLLMNSCTFSSFS
jgi:hypothetical protein